MIPPNLTHAEVGAFLVAVGQHMIDHDVAAEAVLDFEHYDAECREDLLQDLRGVDPFVSLSRERAEELLGLTLAEAIEFNGAEIARVFGVPVALLKGEQP